MSSKVEQVMTIEERASGGSYLFEMVPHEYGITGEHAVSERIYGPYHREHQIQTVLKAIEASLPHGNRMNVLELGGQRRVWWLTGEPKQFRDLARASSEWLNDIFAGATTRAAQEVSGRTRELASPAFKHQ